MDMSLSKLRKLVKDREAWRATGGHKDLDTTKWLNWSECYTALYIILYHLFKVESAVEEISQDEGQGMLKRYSVNKVFREGLERPSFGQRSIGGKETSTGNIQGKWERQEQKP